MSVKEELVESNEDGIRATTTKIDSTSNENKNTEIENIPKTNQDNMLTGDKELIHADDINETSSCNDHQTLACELSEDITPSRGSLNEPKSAIDATARNFRNGFFELVEELRLRRTLDNENENWIKKLLSEKSEVHQKLEEEVSKNNVQNNIHEKQLEDITKQFEERMRQREIDKAKDDLVVHRNMKEMNHLKDEIRALHLAKYSIEKRANELDRELQIQATAREHHTKQLAEIEKKYHESMKQTHEVFDLLNKVEINVGAAARLHKKLAYYNEHQKCQLFAYKRGLESKQQELASLKILVEKLKASQRTAQVNGRINEQSEKKFRMQTELCLHLQSQLNEARKENKNFIDSLKVAHNLVDRHVAIANKHCELESLAQFELDEAKSESDNLKRKMVELKKFQEIMQHESAEKERAWNTEKEEKEKRFADLQSRYEALTLAQNTLEDDNCKLGQQIDDMKNEVKKFQDKGKENAEALADSSLQIEKLKQDHQDQILDLREQLNNSMRQVLEASNAVEHWKERFAAVERKAEELAINLNEIKHKNSSTPTQTDEHLLLQIQAIALGQSTNDIKNEHVLKNKETPTTGEEAEVKTELLKENVAPSFGVSDEELRVVESSENTKGSAGKTMNADKTNRELVVESSEGTKDCNAKHADYGVTGNVQLMTECPENTKSSNVTIYDGARNVEKVVESPEDIQDGTSKVINASNDDARKEGSDSFTSLKAITENAEQLMESRDDISSNSKGTSADASELEEATPVVSFSKMLIVTNNKDNTSDDIKALCCTTLQAGSTSSVLPLLSTNQSETNGDEGKKTFNQTSPLKSCLRDKSLNKETAKQHTYKKLRFDLHAKESQSHAFLSPDKDQFQSDKNGFISQEIETVNGNPQIHVSNITCQNEGKTTKKDKGDHKSYCEGVATNWEQTQTKSSSKSETGISMQDSPSYEERIKDIDGDKAVNSKSDDQELFSDEEDRQAIKFHDTGQQINKIQHFLNNERLRTNRKRKSTDIHIYDNKLP